MQITVNHHIRILTVLLVLCGVVFMAIRATAGPDSDPFEPWHGHWHGEFVAYSIEGIEQYRLSVEQTYKPAGPMQQSAVFTNRSAGGAIETVHAVNLIRDGKLICRTRKIGQDGSPYGEMVEHMGRHLGPGHIMWFRRTGKDGFETFNERIDGDTYWIHGVRHAGGERGGVEIYEGRYVRLRK